MTPKETTLKTTTASLEYDAPSDQQQAALAANSQLFAELAERIQAVAGGTQLVIPPAPGDDLVALIAAGSVMDASKVEHRPGRPSSCHLNTAARAALGQCHPATGYALNGTTWREHSWGVTADGTIIETTEPRDAYFGIVLAGDIAQSFVDAQLKDRCSPEHREFVLADIRTTLSDTLTDLLHAHGGDVASVLRDAAIALDVAETNYASESSGLGAELTVATVDVADELHDRRLERDSHPRLVRLTKDAYSTACGAVASREIVGEKISSETWPELQATFPVSDYLPDGIRVRGYSLGRRRSDAVENFLFEVGESAVVAGVVVEDAERDGDRWAITARIALEDGYGLEDLDAVAEPLPA